MYRLIRRVMIVLAELANHREFNGVSSWDPENFYRSADKFVRALMVSPRWNSSDEYVEDLVPLVWWDIDEDHHREAIRVALAEVGPDLIEGVDFE